MSRIALQLLDEWLFCMQHESSEVSLVASSNFQMTNNGKFATLPILSRVVVCANSRHMLSDLQKLLLQNTAPVEA